MSTVASLTGKPIHYHNTPADLYAMLVEAFGEITSTESPDASWVTFGAGATALTFWPKRPDPWPSER